LRGIVEALRIEPGMVVYDIGCGDGRILRACNAKQDQATYKGVERAWYPYILARMCGQKPNLTYTRGNAFAQNYADADRVVLYLLPKFVDRVAEKIAADCLPGTRIVAVDFPITLWKPKEVIEQKTLPAHMRGRMLYTYELQKPS
jgi:trans-aconitate methyltransferase